MEILQLTAYNCVDIMKEKIKNQEECFVYGVPDGVYVLPALTSPYNKEYCEKNNINILPIPNEGGALVIGNGDFEIGYFTKNKKTAFNQEFARHLIEILKSKGVDAVFAGNDILIDSKYKCAGCSSKVYGDILYCAFHISINVDLELIKNICTKTMSKIPKGLKDFGITTDEIERIFLRFIGGAYG